MHTRLIAAARPRQRQRTGLPISLSRNPPAGSSDIRPNSADRRIRTGSGSNPRCSSPPAAWRNPASQTQASVCCGLTERNPQQARNVSRIRGLRGNRRLTRLYATTDGSAYADPPVAQSLLLCPPYDDAAAPAPRPE